VIKKKTRYDFWSAGEKRKRKFANIKNLCRTATLTNLHGNQAAGVVERKFTRSWREMGS